MRIKKWLMKQQWRIVQIRGIWGLFYGTLLLAGSYFGYIAFFADMGVLGPFAFAAIMLLLFLIIGYIYDKILVMWAPSQEVNIERNPYQYVPSPKEHIFWFPLYSSILEIMEDLADKFDVDRTIIQETREYYAQLEKLRPERKQDLDKAIKLRSDFIKQHPYSSEEHHEK